MPQRWAFLADPEDYGWSHLVREKRAVWDGIKNARAQRNLKEIEKDDLVIVYHTAPDKALQGIARIAKTAYPDPGAEGRVVVDIVPAQPLARPLPLAEMKADDMLKDMSFVRMPRVAVQPITAEQWKRILKLTGTKEA